MDRDLKEVARKWLVCTLRAKYPIEAELRQWLLPSGPWYGLHSDYAGPCKNEMLFVLIDAYSKWPQIVVIQN